MEKIISPIMKKTDGGRSMRVFAKITFNDDKLSITGVEGALRSGNCLGGCGQIVMHLLKEDRSDWKYNDGWDSDKMDEFLKIWDTWHLNDMNAGTPEQTEFINEWKESNKYDFTKACEALKEAGLYEVDGYKYGSGWLTVDVPQEIIEWLFNLPETDVEPAWI